MIASLPKSIAYARRPRTCSTRKPSREAALTTTCSTSASSPLRDAVQNRRSELGVVGIAMQLLIRGFVDSRTRRLRGRDDLLELRRGQAIGIEGDPFQRIFDLRELGLDSRRWLAEDPEPLEETHHVGADSRWRTEIDDFDRYAAADAIQPPDPLLHRRWFPREIVEHQAMAELEVAALASSFGRHEDARPIAGAEPRDLGVAPRRRQLLVEDSACQLRPRAQRVSQHLERLAVRHEDERLLVRPPPAPAVRQQPLEARVPPIHLLRPLPQLDLIGPEHGPQRGARSQRAAKAIQGRRRRCRRSGDRKDRWRKIDRHWRTRRQPADVHTACRARARRQRQA